MRYQRKTEWILGEAVSFAEPVDPEFPSMEMLRKFRLANQRHRRRARKLCDVLLNTPPSKLEARVLSHRTTYLNRPLVQELIRRVEDCVLSNPEKAHDLASLALLLAEEIGPGRPDIGTPAMCSDMKALCHAHAGNTSRILCRWAQAEDHFKTAIRLLWQGAGDLEIHGDTMRLYGTLLRDLRRLDKALIALQSAARDYAAIGASHREGVTLLKIALLYRDQGQHEAALRVHAQACGLLDETRSRVIVVGAWINLALIFADLGQIEQARRVLDNLPSCLEDCPPDSSIHLTRAWAEGIVQGAIGSAPEAIEQFHTAIKGYAALQDPYNVALIHLDLLRVLVRQGQLRQVESCVHGLIGALKEEPIEDEASHVLQDLLTAAIRRSLVEGLIDRAVEALDQHPLPGKRSPSTTP